MPHFCGPSAKIRAGVLCYTGNRRIVYRSAARSRRRKQKRRSHRQERLTNSVSRCLTQIDPMTGDVTIAYQTDGVLERLICGQNIVVFTEQAADGSWRVLRLYEPDGTVAVMEENLPSSPRPYMISNCELVVRWESPEYTALIKAHAADYWDNWDGAHPFPGLEESLKTGDFGEHLPEHIYEDYGVFTNVLRYQNTLTGKVVTLNSVPRCFRIPRYFRSDGTEWALSEARSLYEDTNYNMVRFWLYLPTDKTG